MPAVGIESRTSPRARSLAIKTGRRRRRSTQTPTTRLSSTIGRNCTALRTPISNGLARKVVTAMKGMASSLTWVPSWLTEVASHRLRKPARSVTDHFVDGGGYRKESFELCLANPFADLGFEPVQH